MYLQRLLTNPLYLGQISLHDEIYPGLHEPIVEVVVFEQVQRLLEANRNGAGPEARSRHGALLKGLCSVFQWREDAVWLEDGRKGAALARGNSSDQVSAKNPPASYFR